MNNNTNEDDFNAMLEGLNNKRPPYWERTPYQNPFYPEPHYPGINGWPFSERGDGQEKDYTPFKLPNDLDDLDNSTSMWKKQKKRRDEVELAKDNVETKPKNAEINYMAFSKIIDKTLNDEAIARREWNDEGWCVFMGHLDLSLMMPCDYKGIPENKNAKLQLLKAKNVNNKIVVLPYSPSYDDIAECDWYVI